MQALNKLRVGVLMGGSSAEREVSLKTGKAISAALLRLGCRTFEIDTALDLPRDLRRRRIDVAFVALHGRGGEDGSVQGFLETLGLPYTGSGLLASALAMDKKHSKWIFARHRLPTPPFEVLSARPDGRRTWPFPKLRPPVVVKPTNEGSTIGISLVRKVGELGPALNKAFRCGPEVLLEKYIPGRELTVGVLGDRALPAVEVVAEGGFYDYRAKYRSGRTRYICPAALEARKAGQLQRLAVEAHRVLGCGGATRVDFRLSPSGRPFLLEVNTIPGMTMSSLLPKAARAAGMDFDSLVEWILRDAVRRGKGQGRRR